MLLRATIILLLLNLSAWRLNSQAIIINGKALDEKGAPAVGANVFIKGSFDGTSTGADGSFYFLAEPEETLLLTVSYLGYQPFEQVLASGEDSIWVEARLQPIASELDMVVITAGAFEASDEKKAVVLRPLDIVTTAGATADIAGALNTLPGTQRVGEEGRLFVRGGDAYEIQTFIDGLQVQSPYGSSVPDLPARGRFSPFLFKETTFATGGFSAEYGQALSSALILETQGLPDESITGVSLMSIGMGLSHTQRWERSSIALSGDYTSLGPYIGLVPQDIDWEKPVVSKGSQMIFRHKPDEDAIFKFQGSAQFSDFALQYPDPNDVSQTLPLSLSNDNYYTNATYRDILGEKWSLRGGLSYAYDREDIQQDFQLSKSEQSVQVKVAANHHFSENTSLTFGGEAIRRRFEENYMEEPTGAFHTLLEDKYAAGFAEAESHFGTKLAGRLGVRAEYSSLLGAGRLSPRLSFAYKAGAFSQVSLAYGHFYQKPQEEQLRFNHNLDFERATHYILNYQYQRDKRLFRVEGYYKTYSSLVRFETKEPWLSENSGDGFSRGVDVFYRDRASIRNGDFWISYSFLDTKREYLDFPEPSTPSFASRHNFSGVYKHWLNGINTSIGFTYSYSSPRPYNNPNVAGFNTGRTAAYQDLSFNASYLTNLFGQFTILYVSVTNLPGFKQSFGYRYSSQPDPQGQFTRSPVEPPAKRFFFVGLFVSIGEQFDN